MSSVRDRVGLVGRLSCWMPFGMVPAFRWYVPLIAGLILTSGFASGTSASEASGFRSDFEEAEREGRESGLPILIHFQAWYCGPCRQMDSQVFAFSDVQEALQTGMISVQLDVTRAPEIASRFDATTVPRDVVLYPDGRSETLNVGFMPRASYLNLLGRIRASAQPVRRSSPPERKDLANHETAPSAKSDRESEVAAEQKPSGVTASRSDLPGLDGYCPVKLSKTREWIAGREELQEEYRGIFYRFSSEEARAEFVKDPGHYAPQNLGCDPVILLSSQKAISGRIEYGAFFDDRLYLFSSPGSKSEFKKNPLRFTRIQHAVRVDEIQNSRIE